MSGELVARPGALVRGGENALVVVGTARSTATVSFGGAVVLWEHLPSRTRREARRQSTVVAEAVEVDPAVRLESGRVVEHATAWRFHTDAVVLADVARRLVPAPSGGTRPAEAWEHRSVRLLLAATPPRRRQGVVEVAHELAAPGASLLEPTLPGQPAAATAWEYLPQMVRRDAERLVPSPTTWLGQLVQERSPDGFPTKQDVRALRMSPERAVVILATRSLAPIAGAGVSHHTAQMALTPWVVEQVGFDLLGPDAWPQVERG